MILFKAKLHEASASLAVVPYLGDSETPLATGNHLVPLVMQHVHKPMGLVLTDELRYVGGQWGVGWETNAIS